MESNDKKTCPHCGAELPGEASFCPHCARSVRQRKAVSPPRQLSGRVLYSTALIALAVLLVLAAAVWLYTRPRSYGSDTGELLYAGRAGTYRLCLSRADPPAPTPENHYHAVLDESYRDPVPLYALDPDSGAFVTESFMENVASVSAQISSSDEYVSVTCTEPQGNNEYYPSAAAVTFVDFSLIAPGDREAELVYTITMKNGDVLRLTQKERYSSITVYQYTAQDAPMETIQELQALVDQVAAVSDEYDQIHLYLPAVVYKGGLTMEGRCVNLYGSIGPDGQRTTFTGPTRIASPRGVREFRDIHFLGGGQDTGVQALGTSRLHLIGCRVSGWETGFSAVDNAWINADESTFADNTVGLWFDAQDTPLVSDNFFSGDTFQGNGTAILLEHVSGDAVLKFPGTRFTGNGTDIDNRCGQDVDLSEAIREE